MHLVLRLAQGLLGRTVVSIRLCSPFSEDVTSGRSPWVSGFPHTHIAGCHESEGGAGVKGPMRSATQQVIKAEASLFVCLRALHFQALSEDCELPLSRFLNGEELSSWPGLDLLPDLGKVALFPWASVSLSL